MTDLLPSELARYEEVCRFGQDRLEPLARTIAAAFVDDPMWRWMYDSESLEIEQLLPMARALVADTAAADEIHGFRHHDAVALWRAPSDQVTDEQLEAQNARSAPLWREVASRIGDRAPQLRAFGEASRALRPTEPHWHLHVIAVHPDRQNEALGARVMAPMLERCDRLGLLAHLESSNPRNRPFYERLGFEEAGEVTAGGAPGTVRFLRTPRERL